jgi:hypothetical protein
MSEKREANLFIDGRRPIEREKLESSSTMRIDEACITLLPSATAARNQAIFSQNGTAQIVWIDWLEFECHEKPNHFCSTDFYTAQAEQLVQRLCREDTALPLPRCLGYMADVKCAGFSHRIWMIYQKPELFWNICPRSLSQILQPQYPPPSKADRALLCLELAKCIHALHSDSWLHGDLRSSSIVFFPVGDTINNSSFYLSGFGFLRPVISNYSRAIIPPDFEEIVFLHPAIRDISDHGPGPHNIWRSSDIYAFGIILMEVACWRTIDQVLTISKEHRHWQRLLRKEDLASETRLAFVESFMGEDYAKVVRECLTVKPSVDEESDVLLLEMFGRICEQLSNISKATKEAGF